jgi:hypothetical protein
MDINKISIGADPPSDINVLIEIPQGGVPVKYELDKESGALRVDRFRARVALGRRERLAPVAAAPGLPRCPSLVSRLCPGGSLAESVDE